MAAKNYTCRVEGDRVYVIELPSGIRRSVSDGRSGNKHVTGAFINENTLSVQYSNPLLLDYGVFVLQCWVVSTYSSLL